MLSAAGNANSWPFPISPAIKNELVSSVRPRPRRCSRGVRGMRNLPSSAWPGLPRDPFSGPWLLARRRLARVIHHHHSLPPHIRMRRFSRADGRHTRPRPRTTAHEPRDALSYRRAHGASPFVQSPIHGSSSSESDMRAPPPRTLASPTSLAMDATLAASSPKAAAIAANRAGSRKIGMR